VDSPAKLAPKIHHSDRGTRDKVFAAFRNMQSAGALYWGSETSGLLQVLKGADPSLANVGEFAPKVKMLCEAVTQGGLDRKHFVYSAYTGTITHVAKAMEHVKDERGRPMFTQLQACDFEWEQTAGAVRQRLRLKPTAPHVDAGSVGFVVLKGDKQEQRKLKAAFGFVTPDGERFEGLRRGGAGSAPLVQVLLGARETNQGLTFLRLQHIHIMEPNPRGWGQIVQTMGRGIRRGTHHGVHDPDLRTVRTTIYCTTANKEELEQRRQRQLAESRSCLKSNHDRFHEKYVEDTDRLCVCACVCVPHTSCFRVCE
jgi:hypothetical protein